MTSSSTCQNCGHRLAPWDKFCSQCGQDTLNHPPSLWEFIHEFVQHYVAFEGKLWTSLWALLARPGFLTAEYLAGRKQRYVLPLRLILTLGLVCFIALKLGTTDDGTGMQVKAGKSSASVSVGDSASAPPVDPVAAAKADLRRDRERDAAKPGEDGPDDDKTFLAFARKMPAPIAQAMLKSYERFKADGDAEWKRVSARMWSLAPYAVLASLPFYAGLLALVYRSRRYSFGAHFVFAMHLHAAWYAVLIVGQLPHWIFTAFAITWWNLYPLLALKRVYDGRWWTTLSRAAVLMLLHVVLFMLVFVALFIAGALFV